MRVDKSRLDIVTTELGSRMMLFEFANETNLLRAIADIESTYGVNSNPRHEPAYCRGGKYFDGLLTQLYGCAAHCSYGPWQVMYPTACELGFIGTPEEMANPETNCLYAVRYLNARAAKATSIEQIARSYNGGSINSTAVPQSYIDKLTAAYARRSKA